MDLIATKTRRYGTRALRAGQPFEASRAHGRVLIAIGHATADDGTYRTKTAAPVSVIDIAVLRNEYEAKLGKKPFNGWDAATLRAKIAESAK